MANRKTQTDEPQMFEQQADENGRIRLDRHFTAEEAAAQDAAHVKRLIENRRERFKSQAA